MITLEPPVEGRASFYLEGAPGQMDGVLGAIMVKQPNGGFGPAKTRSDRGGSGVRLKRNSAYLRVKLWPETVPVTARIFMTSFEIGAA